MKKLFVYTNILHSNAIFFDNLTEQKLYDNVRMTETLIDLRYANKFVTDSSFSKALNKFWSQIDPKIIVFLQEQKMSDEIKELAENLNTLQISEDKIRRFVEEVLYGSSGANPKSIEDSIDAVLAGLTRFD